VPDENSSGNQIVNSAKGAPVRKPSNGTIARNSTMLFSRSRNQ
jgi:hypothetical protein